MPFGCKYYDMESFRNFFHDHECAESLLAEFNMATPSVQPAAQPVKQKPWSAKKDEILQMWKNMRQDTPIIVTPIADNPSGKSGSTYGEDGIRITGSWYFISSVLARLKELMYHENPQTKMRLVMRAVDKYRSRPDKQSFVFYFNLEGRSHGKPGRPKG